jgi:PKD repeat protein
MRRRWRLVAVPAVLAACGGGEAPALDAAAPGPDAGSVIADAGAAPDAAPPLGWVDFAASGCAPIAPDVGEAPRCRATAPAALGFVALVSGTVDAYLWSFGDGSPPGSAAAPAHVYALPGRYDVSLTVGGPGGTAQRKRAGWVDVVPAPAGAACALDAQCAPGAACVCGEGEGAACAPPLAAGLCATSCAGGGDACAGGEVCAALGDGPEPWRASLCLAACASDDDCAPGRACRELPGASGGAGAAWVRGCFVAGLVADDGAACVDASGAPDHARCAGGACAALGARGVCATPCATAGDCPSHATCATFAGGEKRCLARCDAAHPCDDDPGLACAPPDAATFTVSEPPAASGYCAPLATP